MALGFSGSSAKIHCSKCIRCPNGSLSKNIQIQTHVPNGHVWESCILPHMSLQGACTSLPIDFKRSAVGL